MIIDTKNKTIKIEGKVSLEELAGTIKELIKRFPKGEWKEYALEPYKNNFEVKEVIKTPRVIRDDVYEPFKPYECIPPPWTVTCTDGAYNFEAELNY